MHVLCVSVGLVVTLGCLWCAVCSCLGLMVIHSGRKGGETDRKPGDHTGYKAAVPHRYQAGLLAVTQ